MRSAHRTGHERDPVRRPLPLTGSIAVDQLHRSSRDGRHRRVLPGGTAPFRPGPRAGGLAEGRSGNRPAAAYAAPGHEPQDRARLIQPSRREGRGLRYHGGPCKPRATLFSYRKYWAERFGGAPLLPMSRAEMDALGWDSCDIIVVTGDAYVDHPSFGMRGDRPHAGGAGLSRRHLAQPDWHDAPSLQGARPAQPVLRHYRRQHGFDGQPLHRGPAASAATTPTRPAGEAASGRTAPSSSTRSAPRGV